MEPFVLFVIGAAVLVALVVAVSRILAVYRMTESSFDVLLFGCVPIVRIKYVDIVGAEIVPAWRALFHVNPFRSMGLGNRIFAKRFVDIQRDGWFSHVIVTPSDPDAFVRELKQRAVAARATDAARR